VHSSGLYCPYPFANDILQNYALDETFTFEAEDPTGRARVLEYTCVIDSVDGVAGDGFATIALVGHAHGSTRVTVCFARAYGDRDVCFDVPLSAKTAVNRASRKGYGVRFVAAWMGARYEGTL
jgi:hypothetical protein